MQPVRRQLCLSSALCAVAPALLSCVENPPAPSSVRSSSERASAVVQKTEHAPKPHSADSPFPLKVSSNGRYLVDAKDEPFLLHGDSPWSISVQLTREQILTYLDTRQAQGFTALLFSAVEHEFSSQWPRWRNVEGEVPFRPQGNFGAPLEPYWQLIDFVVEQANQRGMVCIVQPAYLGYAGGSQGWTAEVLAESRNDLRRYGQWLAQRYRGQGVIWCLGGDYGGDRHPGLLEKQWHIALGIRDAEPSALITAHGGRGQSAYSRWSQFEGFNLNNIYTDGVEYTYAADEYARPGPLPFFHIEGRYDGDGTSLSTIRRQAYVAWLGGGCGHMFGTTPVWGFGEAQANGGAGAAAALATGLSTPLTLQMQYVKQLFSDHAWWTLAPRNDDHLVLSDLGSGATRICPALATDARLAMIWTPGVPFRVNLAALAQRASRHATALRARWFDPQRGIYSDAGNGRYNAAGTAAFNPSTESVLVLQVT